MSDDSFYSFPNRTLCGVLDEMRKCNETRNYAYLLSLIEEAQHYGNRMESALHDKSDIREWSTKRHELKEEIKQLRTERKGLQDERQQLQPPTSQKDGQNT